jgi:hypothetical protein
MCLVIDFLKIEMQQKIFELNQRIELIFKKIQNLASNCKLSRQEIFAGMILKFFENLVRIFK